jgi:hypothetical protein
LATCKRKAFVPADFDREYDAKESPYTVDGKLHIEHVEYHGHCYDFPWDEVRDYYKKWLAGMGFDYDEMAKTGDRIRQTKLKSEG